MTSCAGGPTVGVISPSGVYKILTRHGLRTRWERLARLEGAALETLGLVTERTARRVHPHVAARRPGDLVSLDCFYVGHLKGVGKVWQLTACDAACSLEPQVLLQRPVQCQHLVNSGHAYSYPALPMPMKTERLPSVTENVMITVSGSGTTGELRME